MFGDFRLDAEAYTPEVIQVYEHLDALETVRLGDHAFITDGQHGYHVVDPDSPIRHLTAKCIQDWFVDDSQAERLALETHEKNLRSSCETSDVLLSTAGTLGKAAIVTSDVLPANMDQDVARIHLETKVFDPWYLVAFLNSSIGRLQSERVSTGQVQRHIALGKIREFSIPVNVDQASIADLVRRAFETRKQSETLYTEAKALLQAELGMDELDLSHQRTYTQSYSHAWAVGRWDAEYFQPKYLEVLRWLTKGKHEALGKVAKLEKGVQARSESGNIPYASIKDIEGFIIETEEVTDADRIVFAEPDAVVLTVTGATIGKVAINAAKERIAICGDLVSIQPHRLSPHYLLAVLDSPMIQELCDRNTTGATNGHLAVSAVLGFPIPILPKEKEDLISDKVKQAIHAHNMSKCLLEEAKQRVEEMVLGKE